MSNNEQTKKTWTVELEEGTDGELLLPFPPDLLSQMGWAEGTEIWWDIQDDGSVIIKEKKNNNDSISS